VIECASRGLHVIAEKPLALSMADLERMRETVKAKRVRLTCLLKLRSERWLLAMRQMVQDGTLGQVVQAAGQKSYRYAGQGAWKKKEATFGGTIPWVGVEVLDAMRFATGQEYREVFAMQARAGDMDLGEMETTASGVLRMSGGGTATFRLDYLRPSDTPSHGDDRIRIAGTNGIAEHQMSTGLTLLRRGAKPVVVETLPPERWIFLEFLQSLKDGSPCLVTEEDAFRATENALKAWESARTGHPVKLG
jgi:predicted dehydrogenase